MDVRETTLPGEERKPKLVAEQVVIEYVNQRTGNRLLALDRIDLTVYEGEFVSIVGPSGCGKSTFLKAVDGLLKTSSGTIYLDGKRVVTPGRDRAMVFQEASLLPWRTAIGNVLYALEAQGASKKEAIDRAGHFIKLVRLSGFEHHYPNELSVGMQQRVNLARALVCQPEVLLLDEPFAALDAQTRELMQSELLEIWEKTRATALFVTHQISEALLLSDRVAVFKSRPGRICEIINVTFPRPRNLRLKRDPHFLGMEDYIWSLIEEQVKMSSIS